MTRIDKIFLTLTLATAAVKGQNLESISVDSLTKPEAAVAQRSDDDAAKWRRAYNWSVATLGAATAADVASSFKFSRDGQREANSLLASGGGRYGAKGAAIEAGVVGASLLMQRYLVKHHPGLRLPLAISNFAFAGFQAFNVRHNVNY